MIYRSGRGSTFLMDIITAIMDGKTAEQFADEQLERMDPDYEIKQACAVLGIPYEPVRNNTPQPDDDGDNATE